MIANQRCNLVLGALLIRYRSAVTVGFVFILAIVVVLVRCCCSIAHAQHNMRSICSLEMTSEVRAGWVKLANRASRLTIFTVPYSRPRRSTEILLCEAGRLPPVIKRG